MDAPSLNNWTSFFLIVAGTGLFVSLLLGARFKKNRGNIYLAIVLSSFSLILIQYVLFWSRYVFEFPHFRLLPQCLLLIIAPTLYLFARNKANIPFQSKIGWLYLPAALALTENVLYWTGVIRFPDFIHVDISNPLIILKWVTNPWTVVAFYAFVAILIWQLRNHETLKAASARKVKGIIPSIVIFLAAFTVAYGSYFVLVKFPFFNAEWDYAISIVMSGGIYLAAAVLYLQPGTLEDRHQPSRIKKQSVLPSEVTAEIFEKIKLVLKTEKLHHDEGLRIEVLSEKLSLPRHYISHAINTKSGQNFNRFINDYRLCDAEELLIAQPKMSIKQIYFQVGFNNKATFYQAFKEKHGCTPQEYRNHLLKKAS